MKLSESNKQILLVNLHETIDEYSRLNANHLQHNRLTNLVNYPPNGALTEQEQAEITKLAGNEILKSALQKILASNTADVFFNFFTLLDGTSDPLLAASDWEGVVLIDLPEEELEEEEMLHDDFYATYWDWKEFVDSKRRQK